MINASFWLFKKKNIYPIEPKKMSVRIFIINVAYFTFDFRSISTTE